jgi:hypothetical protein
MCVTIIKNFPGIIWLFRDFLIYIIRGQRVMLDREIKGAHRRTIFLVSRQDFAPCANFVASIMPCRNNFGKISPKFLESAEICRIFAPVSLTI